jgi:hypothetical protein
LTTQLRSLHGIVFAALLALSLIATTSQALADTRGGNNGNGPNLFDQGFVDQVTKNLPRPLGRLGISWE